jgi:phosphinothricin acetyltransferase
LTIFGLFKNNQIVGADRVADVSMTIRDATEADLPAIVAIYNASIPGRTATADTEPVSIESRRDWFRDHDSEKRPLWVAVDSEVVAGWLSFQSFYGRPAYYATAEISLYVAPEWQRKGIGRELLVRAVERARGLGLKTLLGFIFGHNEASLQLFESFGFQRWGVLPGVAELDHIERNLIILGRRITE